MFTGLVQEIGRVVSLDKVGEWWELTIQARLVLKGTELGYSIAVNGVCLTVSRLDELLRSIDQSNQSNQSVYIGFMAKLLPETQRCTNLLSLNPGDEVNLEKALALGDHVGGHMVQGHVDQTCPILSVEKKQEAISLKIALPVLHRSCYYLKGIVCVDGISLTIMSIDANSFSVDLVEETQFRTTLGSKLVGMQVNLEADSQAKLIAGMLPSLLNREAVSTTAAILSSEPDTVGDWKSRMQAAIKSFAAGGFVIVMDDYQRENEGDLIISARDISSKSIAFLIRHSTGILCAPLSKAIATKLDLQPMIALNTDPNGTAFTVSVDAVSVGTGVSASDRASSFRALADSNSTPNSFRRPGHIFPLVARTGGVKERRGHTEASIELCRLAGLPEVAVIGELQKDDGSMYRLADCREFGERYNIPIISVEDISLYV